MINFNCLTYEHFCVSGTIGSRMLYVFCFLIIFIVLKFTFTRFKVHIPPTAIIFVFGILMGKYVIRRIILDNKNFTALVIPGFFMNLSYLYEKQFIPRIIFQTILICIPMFWLQASLVGGFMHLVFLRDLGWTLVVTFQLVIVLQTNFSFTCLNALQEIGTEGKPIIALLEAENLWRTYFTLIFYRGMETLRDFYKTNNNQADPTKNIVLSVAIDSGTGLVAGYITSKLVNKIQKLEKSAIIIHLVTPYLIHYVLENIFKNPAILSLSIIGLIYNYNRNSLSKNIDNLLCGMWSILSIMSEYITVLYSGCIIGKIVMDDIIPYDALLGIILFILITVCRVLIYMILSPILIHIGYYLGYTEIMVAAFGFYVNPMMVIALLMTLTNPQEFSLGVRILTIYMVVQLCSMFVSTVIFMASFRFTKFSQFSMAAKTNMNNSIEHLKITTANFIFILKTDKSNYDTDWNMVTKYSTLKHPYESDLDYDMTNILSKNLVVTCPNCLRDTPRKLSKREQNEIKLVTKNRILIARKIAYLRHINAGTITYDAGNTLIFIVEDAIGSPKKEIKMKHFRNRFSLKSLTRNVVKMLSEVLFFDVLHRAPRPKSVMYCLCWILVKYHVTDAIIILTNMTAFVLMITLWKIDFILLDPFVIYIFEIVFITLALSSPKFFPTGIKHSAKNVEVVYTALVLSVVLIITMKHLVTYQTLRAPYPILAERLSLDIIYFSKVLNALRRIICLNCGSPLRAFLQKHSKLICTKRTQAAFELGKAYITVEQELLDILHNIVNNQELLMEIFTEIQENVIDIMMCLSYITKLRDWISTTAESKSAMIKIITAMYMSGQELRDAGWLSVKEFKKMSDLLTLKISKIQSIKHIDRPTPKEMFYEIVWLMDEEPEIVEYLLSNTQSLVFQPGEVLVRVNNYIPGIYIVTSGLFIETFVPDKLILNRMDTKGELPIMDNINLYTLESPNKIFNSVGAVIGELGVLTGRKYSTNIIAKTYSTVLFIQKLHIEEAFARSNDPIHGLKAKMWKNIMFRMAKFILSLEPVYQYVSKIMLSLTLSNHAFLPEISFFKTFCFDQKVQDAILCEGQCMNVDSKDHYIAPCYIPRGIQTVSFVRSHDGLNHAKLLLLLKKGSDEYEFMSKTFMSSDVDPQAKNVFVKYVGTSQKKKKHLLNVEKKTQQADIRVKAFKVERSGTGSVRDSSISTISLSKSQYSTASGKYRGSEQPSERTDRSEKTERAERAERKASSPNF